MGTGEVKLHKVFQDGSGVGELDSEPIQVLNLIPAVVPEGASVILLWDPSVCEPDDEEVFLPRYLVIRVTDSDERPRGWGIFRSSGTTSGTDTGLINCPTTVTDSFNSSASAPVIQFQVSTPPNFDRIVVNQPGIYRFTFKSDIRFSSPAEPGGGSVFSYQDKVGTVTSNGTAIGAGNTIGTTEDLCSSRLFRRERFWLIKNQNFGSPTVSDAIALGEPWACYECGNLYWHDPHYSLPVLMDAGDTLSIWRDTGGRVGSYDVTFRVEFSIHFSSYEPDLAP